MIHIVNSVETSAHHLPKDPEEYEFGGASRSRTPMSLATVASSIIALGQREWCPGRLLLPGVVHGHQDCGVYST